MLKPVSFTNDGSTAFLSGQMRKGWIQQLKNSNQVHPFRKTFWINEIHIR